MPNIKRLIPKRPSGTLLKVSLAFFVITLSFLTVRTFRSLADSPEGVATKVTIGNAVPVFTAGPAESPATSSTSPIASSSVVTFSATATDDNGQPYYLTICSTNSITDQTTGAGTCAAGATTYCSSTSATASGTGTSCTYTTSSSDVFSNSWYAFVCDNDPINAGCSLGAQGTGDSGSPLFVNHAPVFTSISHSGNPDPGQDITWTSVASNPDFINDNGLRIKLLVCKTEGISGGACDGGANDTWCTSDPATVNPSCKYSVPSIAEDGLNNAYVYIVNNFNTPASGGAQGTPSNFSINNVAPTITNVTINGGAAITLTESSTKTVPITATVTDRNGCTTSEITTVKAYAYRGGTVPATSLANCIAAGASPNKDYCYNSISCTQVADSCNSGTGSADYSCSASIEYYADPTDEGTEFPSETWYSSVRADDDDAANVTASVSTGVEMNSLIAFTVTDSINYGYFSPNGTSASLNQELVTTPTGNVGLDQSHQGTNMCTDYNGTTNPTCASTIGTAIPVSKQKYNTTSTAYAAVENVALTTSAVEVELNVPKVRNGTVTTKSTWWGITIPSGTLAGVYNGLNTIVAISGETANW